MDLTAIFPMLPVPEPIGPTLLLVAMLPVSHAGFPASLGGGQLSFSIRLRSGKAWGMEQCACLALQPWGMYGMCFTWHQRFGMVVDIIKISLGCLMVITAAS